MNGHSVRRSRCYTARVRTSTARKAAVALVVAMIISTGCDLAASEAPAAEDAVEPVATPPARRPGAPLRIAVISDLNRSYGSVEYGAEVRAAVARVIDLQPDVVLSTGDMVAGQRRGLDYAAMWQGFHGAVSDPLAEAGLPFAVTPGNHDASAYARYAAERAEFVAQWNGARKPPLHYLDDTDYPLRYSFVMGDVLFVSLDATRVGALSDDQMAWLGRQLEAGADRRVKILFSHLPLYPFARGREREIIGDPALERLAEAHGVTLLLSGHHHAFYPGRRKALRLVGTSCLGSGRRALLGAEHPSPRSIVVLEVENGELVSVEAHAGADFTKVVPRGSLPPQVGRGDMRILRDDL